MRARGKILIWLLLLSLFAGLSARAEAPGTMRIKLFKSGKADAFLIRTGAHAVLIDAAEEDDAEDVLRYMQEKGVGRIDLMILTHFDNGHIGGAPQILRGVQVDRVMVPDYDRLSVWRERLDEALREKGIAAEVLREDSAFTLDGCRFEVIVAGAEYYSEDEDNDFSLVTRIRHGDNSFLFGADIMSQRMRELLDSGRDLRSTFLQVPDHGRNRDLSEAFIRAVAPRYAVITCSKKNPPAGAVLAALEQAGARTWLTMDGDIALTSDGQDITFKQ